MTSACRNTGYSGRDHKRSDPCTGSELRQGRVWIYALQTNATESTCTGCPAVRAETSGAESSKINLTFWLCELGLGGRQLCSMCFLLEDPSASEGPVQLQRASDGERTTLQHPKSFGPHVISRSFIFSIEIN